MKSLINGAGGEVKIELDDIQIPNVNDKELINGYPVPLYIDSDFNVYSSGDVSVANRDIQFATTVYIYSDSIDFTLDYTYPSDNFIDRICSSIISFLNNYFDSEQDFLPSFDDIPDEKVRSFANQSPRCVHPLIDDWDLISLYNKQDVNVGYDVFTTEEAKERGLDISGNQMKLVTVELRNGVEMTVLPYANRASVEEELSKVKNLLESKPFEMEYDDFRLAYDIRSESDRNKMNNSLLEQLNKVAPNISSSVQNPYEAVEYPSVSDMLPWFAKYGVDGVELWNVYIDYLFSDSPVDTYIPEIESYIADSHKSRMECLEMWVDLMITMKHEYPPLRGDSEVEKILLAVTGGNVSDEIRGHIRDGYQIPWKDIDWIESRVRKQILDNYSHEDFSYQKDRLEKGELLKISEADKSANIIFEVDEYTSLFGDGSFSPKAWISYPIAAQPHPSNSEVTNRRQLSEILEEKSAKPITKAEIASAQPVDKSDLTTVVYRNENDRKIQSSGSFGEDIIESVYMVRKNPQDRNKYTLGDFLGDDEVFRPMVVVEDEQWFTGTAVSEFPLKLSVNEYESPSEFNFYEEFPENHVTFKSDRKVFVVPAWEEIAGEKFEDSDYDSPKEWKMNAIQSSEYDEESVLIITKHRIA